MRKVFAQRQALPQSIATPFPVRLVPRSQPRERRGQTIGRLHRSFAVQAGDCDARSACRPRHADLRPIVQKCVGRCAGTRARLDACRNPHEGPNRCIDEFKRGCGKPLEGAIRPADSVATIEPCYWRLYRHRRQPDPASGEHRSPSCRLRHRTGSLNSGELRQHQGGQAQHEEESAHVGDRGQDRT